MFFDFPSGTAPAFCTCMHGSPKRIVYVLRSDTDPARHYVGITNDLASRLHWHNHGPSGHTTSHRPGSLVVSLEFASEMIAVRFEKHLKTGRIRSELLTTVDTLRLAKVRPKSLHIANVSIEHSRVDIGACESPAVLRMTPARRFYLQNHRAVRVVQAG